MTTTTNDMDVKNNETINEIEALEEFEIEEVEVDTHEYPATDVVDLANEIQTLTAKVADGTATDADEDRLQNLMTQRKAQRTGKSIADVTKAIQAGAKAIQTDELEGSWGIALDNFIAANGGKVKMAEDVATYNAIAATFNGVEIPAGPEDTATGKYNVQWAQTGRMTFANQRRYYANQLMLLAWAEKIAIETGVPKGTIAGVVARDEHGQITPGTSTMEYTAKVAGGSNNTNRAGGTVTAVLPDGYTLWLKDDYTGDVPGYGTVTVPSFSNAKIRNLFDAKKVATGAFKEGNVLRNQGPFKALALAFKNLGYYDSKLGPLAGAGTSYDSTLQKALLAVGANDNYALAQKIVIKVDGQDDITVAEYDAKIKGSIA
jgi:hypothetical protein